MATDGRATGVHNVMTGKRLADRWHVLDAIGGGGMGDVYRGFDLKLKVPVAIKVLSPKLRGDPSIVKRFSDEVDTLKRSAHPNIAIIHDFSKDEDIIYLVMEFLNGPTLNAVLDESPDRRLHLQRVRRIFTQILDALAVVHERDIIHRDLKPENAFVLRLGSGRRNTDVVKLIDFGIAKFRGCPQAARPGLTRAGEVLGTPFYMSPEQCRGETNVDNRTDIYAVGVLLYEAATGRLPFNKPTSPEIMVAHLNECPDAPRMLNPKISPELEMVILRALAKKPEGRFQDAVEFSEALEAAIPEDPMFYRDSQRVSPVSGKAVATPPRVPTEDQPTDEQPDPTKTPTRLFSERRPPAGIALARTITPAGLKREVWKARVDAVVGRVAKNFGVWVGKTRPLYQYSRYFFAFLIFVAALALSTIILPVGGGDANASDGDVGETTADATAVTDVLIVKMPVFVPLPPLRDAGADTPEDAGTAEAETPEADAGEDEARTEATEADVASSPTPAGYTELLAEGTAAFGKRNYRLAARRFTAATELWREGADAWRGLGDALLLLGKRPEAKAAFREYLDLAPNAPDAAYYRGIVGQ